LEHPVVVDVTLGIGGFGRVKLVSLPCNLILSKAVRPLVLWYENMTSSVKPEVRDVS